MRQLKFGIPLLCAFFIATGLFGCADENHWEASSNEMGSISLTLSTDSGIKTAKPVFRSDENESAPDPNDLNTYITVPKPEDFSIKLEKSDESFSKTWTSLKGFLNYTKENFFSTGAYTLTAFYGEKGKQDFNSPYFETSTSFNVLSDQVYEVDLVAELMNSMVKINYTDRFKDYMSDFYASLRTEGRANEIIFGKNEIDAAFIEPNNATLSVHITTKDKNYTTDLKVGDFPPMAKTLHNITLDVVDNENGTGQLQFVFDDALDQDIVKIDLTDELLTAEAPVISCKGFTDGQTIEVLENSPCLSNIKMEAYVPGIIGSAVLTVESSYRPKWGSEIDLCAATEEQKNYIKEAFGEDAVRGFGFTGELSEIAVLDLTNLGSILPLGTHKISLKVTDKYGRTSNTSSVTLDSQPIELVAVGSPTIGYCAKNTSITVDYNGNDPLSELSFKTISDQANSADIEVLSCQELPESRSIENKRYMFELQLPDNVTSAREKIRVDICHNGQKMVSCDVNVTIPKYDFEYDEFSKYAYIRVFLTDEDNNEIKEPDSTLLSLVVANLSLKFDGKYRTSGVLNFIEEGYLAVSDLQPGTPYSISSTITKGDIFNNHKDLLTESAEKIPNGDFSTPGKTEEIKDIQVGGQYDVTVTWNPVLYTLKSSISYTEPANWATMNSLTAWPQSSNINTWYIVPSSWREKKLDDSGQETGEFFGLMRSVGYHHEGADIPKSGGYMNKSYYCENAPSDNQLKKAAGELFLGSYKYNEILKTEGVNFESRPSSISFDYDYTPCEGTQDKGYAKIELIGTGGRSLGSKKFELERGSHTGSYSFEYSLFGEKAAKLIVSFKSSTEEIPPVIIPTGSALDEKKSLGNHTLPANSYHALATGSVLKVYNVVAHYGDEETPVTAPKRSTKKKK